MELLRVDDVHLTYPPRFRSNQRPPDAVDTGDSEDAGGDVVVSGDPGEPTPALRGLSLSVSSGESVGLLGQSGSGRTTLLSLIAGVLRPDRGTVHIRGHATGLTATGVGSFGDLDVRRNIERTLVLLGTRHRRAQQLVPEVARLAGLADSLDRPLRDLPRSQARLLAYATALHCEPSVFLADEDLGQGLPEIREAAEQRITSYPDSAHAVVIATNRPAVLRSLCTRAVVLDQGQVAFDGSVDDALRTLRGRPRRTEETAEEPP